MTTNNNDVKKIMEFIQAKIDILQGKLKAYDSPIMQEMIKNSQHLQFEHTRLSAALEENQENLLIIQKFNPDVIVGVPVKVKKKAVAKPKKTNEPPEQK